MSKIRVGIVGAAGYVGGELIRILHGHPEAEIAVLSRVRAEGDQQLVEVQPQLRGVFDDRATRVIAFDAEAIGEQCDVVFIAAPHGQAIQMTPPLLARNAKVIDMGADFRLRDASVYEKWYKVEHTQRELLSTAVYGLPELNRGHIAGANLVANPGCYPTSAALAVAPLVRERLIDLNTIIFDSKSGVSGAGRSKVTTDYLFTEIVDDFKAYGVTNHRHTPEIEQTLSGLAGEAITVSFTPHLLPISRGILTTAYATLKPGVDEDRLREAYSASYACEPFVRLYPKGELPQIKYVVGSNYCDAGFTVDPRTSRVIAICCIDNLVKGAAGVAIQNMNLMFGLPETTGLLQPPFFP